MTDTSEKQNSDYILREANLSLGAKPTQDANLRGFRASMNPRFQGGIPDFMDGLPDFMDNFNTF